MSRQQSWLYLMRCNDWCAATTKIAQWPKEVSLVIYLGKISFPGEVFSQASSPLLNFDDDRSLVAVWIYDCECGLTQNLQLVRKMLYLHVSYQDSNAIYCKRMDCLRHCLSARPNNGKNSMAARNYCHQSPRHSEVLSFPILTNCNYR